MQLTEARRFTLTIVALASVSLTVSLSSTSMSNAVPVITSQFHGTDVQAFWSGTANLLCSAVFQPAFAVFSYIFGRKPLVRHPNSQDRISTNIEQVYHCLTSFLSRLGPCHRLPKF